MKGLLLSILCVAFLVGCTPPKEMPDIDNPTQLANDCQALSADTSVHTIDRDKWPDSVRKLNPVLVTREANGIFIMTYADPDGRGRGYAVAVMKPGDSDHYKISDTTYSKIYRFDFKP